MAKKDEGKKNKNSRLVAGNLLTTLIGKSYKDMNKNEQDKFITLIAQLVGVMDEGGLVKK